jgi:hypothetical protein
MFPTCLKGFAQYILFFASLFLFYQCVFCFLGFELISMDRESRYRLGSVLGIAYEKAFFLRKLDREISLFERDDIMCGFENNYCQSVYSRCR